MDGAEHEHDEDGENRALVHAAVFVAFRFDTADGLCLGAVQDGLQEGL